MVKLTPFDAAKYLDSKEAIAAYLTDALEDGDPAAVTEAIGTVARAQGMTDIAREAELSRENLYKALRAGGHPEFDTVMRVLHALGVKLVAKPVLEHA